MLLFRFLILLCLLGSAVSFALYVGTGNPRYKAWAWKAFRATVVVLFVLMALFAVERVLAPIA